MKKMFFGSLVFVSGLFGVALFYVNAIMHPWNYHGIDGILGSFLGTGTLIPFIASCCIVLMGLCICGYEAYFKK